MKHLENLTKFHKEGMKCVRSVTDPFADLLKKNNSHAKDIATTYVAMIGYGTALLTSPLTYVYGGFSSLKNKSPTENGK